MQAAYLGTGARVELALDSVSCCKGGRGGVTPTGPTPIWRRPSLPGLHILFLFFLWGAGATLKLLSSAA